MREFKADWETIHEYLKRAINEANRVQGSLACEFNGARFIITSESTIESGYSDFVRVLDENRKKYMESDEYKKLQAEKEEKTRKLNEEAIVLLERFKKLNLSSTLTTDRVKLLEWLCEYQDYSDNCTVTTSDDRLVIKLLEEAGYTENDIETYKNAKDCADVKFRCIIGQAIHTMRVLALHQVIIHWAKEWIRKYNKD